MADLLVFQHHPAEDLGLFAGVLLKHQYGFRVIRLYQGELPNEDWEGVKALIILGGPMNVSQEERYPFLKWEKTIVRTAIEEGIAVLGICLGAQIIANAVGAPVYQGQIKEVGWHPVSMTPEGQVDSLLGYLPEQPTVFQWHGDGFDLPAGAVRLAFSPYYENQAFRIGKNVYGLQFHLEVTPSMIERWMDCHWRELAQVPYVVPDKIRADTRSYAQNLRYFGEKFFTEFVRRVFASKGRREEGQQAKL